MNAQDCTTETCDKTENMSITAVCGSDSLTAKEKLEAVNRILSSNPCCINDINDRAETALHLAVIALDIELVKVLLAHGADASLQVRKIAIRHKHKKIQHSYFNKFPGQ